MYNYHSQRGSMIEFERAKSQGIMLNSTKSDILTNSRHQGCLERITILTQELERMAEAQYQANELIKELKQELSLYESQNQQISNSLQNGREQELLEELMLEKQKFNSYKNLKENEVEQLEDDLNNVHREVKQLKLLNFDLNHKYEMNCLQMNGMKDEMEQIKSQQQEENNQSGMLNQLHEDVLELQSENKNLQKQNQEYQKKIEELMQYIEGMQTQRVSINEQYTFDLKQKQNTLEDHLFPSRKDEIIKKYSRILDPSNLSQNTNNPNNQPVNSQCTSKRESTLNLFLNTQNAVQNNSNMNQQTTTKREQLRSKAKPVSQFQLTASNKAQYA